MSYSIRKPQEIVLKQDFFGKELIIRSGILAPNCDGAVRIKLGGTEVLVTAVMKRNPNPDKDFLPLTIDFRDSNHAVGKIWGGAYRKREGRPTEMVTLYGRIVDRTLRPMFPKGMINDIVISVTPLSFDKENDLATLGILGGSLATLMAGIPFDGPVSGVRIGFTKAQTSENEGKVSVGDFVINPLVEEFENNGLNLLVSGKKGSMNMIEMDGMEIDEETLRKAFEYGQEATDLLCDIQSKYLAMIQPKDLSGFAAINYPSDELKAEVAQLIPHADMEKFFKGTKDERDALFIEYRKRLRDKFGPLLENRDDIELAAKYTWEKVNMALELQVKEYYKELILDKNIRIDGRAMDEIRQLYCEVGILDRVHGSALFRRGDTQILNTTTLWAPGDVQLTDDMMNDGTEKRYMHHYNFPPFSVNEAMRIRGTGNREIGHGRLAEKALEFMIPSKQDFPYTIRLVSDCLASGGSTSMGSVCASTLSLMDAGVPIKKPVSGIAMGICSRTNDQGIPSEYKVLIDIQGAEDHNCDMDFKVAGTPDGITAIQLDMKIRGITVDMAMEVVQKANIARLEIMEFMLQTLAKPRLELSEFAPKITVIQVDPSKIKIVIGKGGEMIDKIIAETGVKIDFDDEGTCMITSRDAKAIQRTIEIIQDLTYEPKIGDEFDGVITRIENYGIFVKYTKDKIGLSGARNLGLKFGENPATFYKIDQRIRVKIVGITPEGKIDLQPVK